MPQNLIPQKQAAESRFDVQSSWAIAATCTDEAEIIIARGAIALAGANEEEFNQYPLLIGLNAGNSIAQTQNDFIGGGCHRK